MLLPVTWSPLSSESLSKHNSPPAKARVFHKRAKPYAPGIHVKRVSTVCRPCRDCYLPLVNGPSSLMVSCLPDSSSFNWFAIYSAMRLASLPAVSTTLELSAPILVFQLPKLLIQHRTALSLPGPQETRHRRFRRNLHQHMYVVWTHLDSYDLAPFHSHSRLKIFPLAFRSSW